MNQEESSQAAAVRRQLVQLVGTHGPDLLDDARRVRAMLGDAVVGANAEANLVGLAISSGVPAKLRQGTSVSAIVTELQQTSSVQPQDAQWAVHAIAAALGMEQSEPPPSPPAPSPTPAPARDDRPAPPAPDTGGPAGPDDLVVSGAGAEVVVRAGSSASIGRDPGATLVLNSTAVSRLHARVERVGSGWEYTDVGSTQGSFVGGSAVHTVTITSPVEIELGQGAEAVRLRFTTGAVARPAPERARPDVAKAAPATEIPGRPGGVLAGGAPRTEVTGAEALTVSLAGTTRTVASGGTLTVGREVDNDLVSPGSTASRHHLRIEQAGGSWVLRDLGSSAGTWLDGKRVNETPLVGDQEFVLGEPGRGDRLTTVAPGRSGGVAGVSKAKAATSALRGKGPAWLVPAAAAAVVVLVLGVVAVGLHGHGGSSGPTRLTDAQLAEATVKLVRPDGAWGSGVVVDSQRGLIMTNAHVAQPAAIGQGLPPYSGVAPEMEPQVNANADPKEIAVYVSSDGKSAALPKYWATPVAWDGYLDVAIVKINRLYDGPDYASAPVAGSQDWADLPEVQLGDSRDLASGQDVGIWGYPQDPGSKAPNFGSGTLSSPVEDARLANRWGTMANDAIWNFEGGQILHGNSGGLAFDEKTHTMIGIPTWYIPDQDAGAPEGSRMRPIDFAKPVLAAAQAGRRYVSPYAVPLPASATITTAFPQAPLGSGDPVGSCKSVGNGGQSVLEFRYSGFTGSGNIDLAANLYVKTDAGLQLVDSAMSTAPNRMKPSGCVAFVFPAHHPTGNYVVVVGGGGNLHVLYHKYLNIPW